MGGPDRLVQVRVVGGIYRPAGNGLAQVDHAGRQGRAQGVAEIGQDAPAVVGIST